MDIVVEGKKKRRGRRPKNEKREYIVNMEQTKYLVDLGSNKEQREMVYELLGRVNDKAYGHIVLFKDLAFYGLSKITDKDIEKVQEMSLTEMEKVERSLDEFNKKNGSKLKLGEYLLKKLNLN